MPFPNMAHYTAAKHGVVGLMRTLALELAPDFIRVNSVHPTSVDTDMIHNHATYELFAPDLPEAGRTRAILGERFQAVPRADTVVAKPTFRVIASMNPYDNVGTTRLSTSVHDRMCRLAISYQDAGAERGIVALRAPLPDMPPALRDRLIADAVAVTRATREHADIRQGSSVRGAIDLTLVAGQLLELADLTRDRADEDAAEPAYLPGERYPDIVFDAMVVALSGRIFLDETVDATPEAVLRQIWEDHFILAPAAADPG
jgi:MoxR-like ATPase